MTTADTIRATVRERYAAIARSSESCCGSAADASCGSMAPDGLDCIGDAYAGVEGHVAEADLGLGCGVPTRHAGMTPGVTVLDLGSGAGNDAFIARRIVGEAGHVIGVDMTAPMLERARANAMRLGYANVEFRAGEIEALPVDDASVDVVISNCVLNLVPDKARAFAETFRVLRPGGHFCVSDMVSVGELPEPVRADALLLVGCVAGAMERDDYLGVIADAGFTDVRVAEERSIELPEPLRAAMGEARIMSVTVLGRRPSG